MTDVSFKVERLYDEHENVIDAYCDVLRVAHTEGISRGASISFGRVELSCVNTPEELYMRSGKRHIVTAIWRSPTATAADGSCGE